MKLSTFCIVQLFILMDGYMSCVCVCVLFFFSSISENDHVSVNPVS